MILKEFDYLAPQTVAEAVSLLETYKDEAELIAGGTDLLVMMRKGALAPKYIVDIKPISSLDYVKWDEKEGLTIGALTKVSTIVNSDVIKEKCFSLYEAAESFGTTQIRNMATIGGNICRSAPDADLVPPLLVFDAELKLMGPRGERTVLLENFITGAGENILNNEILTQIKISVQKRPHGTAYKKLGRLSEDLAIVNCAVGIIVTDNKCEDVRIALGAVAPTAVRAKKVEQSLKGREINSKVIEDATKRVTEDIAPRTKFEYKVYTSKMLIKGLINEAVTRLGGSA